ncbi:rRNA methyltransferase 2, mitochondrial-like isoform X3 [Halichondria panicea]|uniref:rRNA methyltransferase 2, mitochondrial-like isoform X3 n=1 Tax=Halichondria panicea TaxID=6063 RepID=UPI00312B6785
MTLVHWRLELLKHLRGPLLGTRAKGTSSNKWLHRQQKDPLVKRAVVEQYRCRSAYKLIELDDKFRFLNKGAVVVDCGASPGAWSQVAAQRVDCGASPGAWSQVAAQRVTTTSTNTQGGMVVALDIQEIADLPGVLVMGGSDVTDPLVQERVRELLGRRGADVVMSDMAPNASGIREMDHQKIMQLAESALALSHSVLKEGGVFLCKLWQGPLANVFRSRLKANFSFTKECRLQSTRQSSSELFIYAEQYHST